MFVVIVLIHIFLRTGQAGITCETTLEDHPCKDVTSSKTLVPNLLSHSSQQIAISKLSELPLNDACSDRLKFFLCSIYAPPCATDATTNYPIPPCKGLCENVRADCDIRWPDQLDCSKFPEDGGYCKCENGSTIVKLKTDDEYIAKSHGLKYENVLVTLPTGVQLLGSTMETRNNKLPIFAFRGIPYAEPPIGDLRFRPPVAKRLKAGEKPFDTTQEGPECLQVQLASKKLSGVEDCLVLNVYTRNIKKNDTKRPVMVFIHGGAFTMGSGASSSHPPRRLLDYDVVLVTFNYRLHVFGFLSTMDEASPGNYGLMDQTEALKWVRDNIEVFNGDPNNVNIFGESAGSASVVYQLITPLSKGLFHSAIAQSGSPLSRWARKSIAVSQAEQLANDVGCTTTNTTKMVQCLRMMPVEILNQQTQIYLNSLLTPFRPVTDGYFLPNDPSYLLKHGDINRVPLIIGSVQDEGTLFYAVKYGNTKQNLTDEFLVNLISFSANIEPRFVTQETVDLIRNEYFQSIEPNDSDAIRKIISKILGDHTFVVPFFQTVHLLHENGMQFFMYSYDLSTNRSLAQKLGLTDFQGPSHVDDLSFLFVDEFINSQVNQTQHLLLQMWTQFAQYKHPTKFSDTNITQWPISNKDNIQIYHLNYDFHITAYDPQIDKLLKFWLQDFAEAMKIP